MARRSLQTRGYVATAADIEELVRQNRRSDYLKALVATSQRELARHPGLGIPGQRQIVAETHGKLYAGVLAAISSIPGLRDSETLTGNEKSRRAKERNNQSNFARTAKSHLMNWLRTPGHDLGTLDAATVTKTALRTTTSRAARKAVRPGLLRRQTQGAAKKLLVLADRVADLNREEAIEILTEIQHGLAAKVTELSHTQHPRRTPVKHR